MISINYKIKFIIILIVVSTFVFNSMAQTNNNETLRLRKLTLTADKFLLDWLVKKDNKKALKYFSKLAFSNAEMLNESCAGYIADSNYISPNLVKDGVTKFLSDFSSDKANKTFDEWLAKTDSKFDEGEYKEFAIALPKTTKYLLFSSKPKIVKSILGNESRFLYLNKYVLLENTKTQVIGLNLNDNGEKTIGYVYLIWLLENKDWKIVHAGMFCQ
jgi:hypothetical protein